MAAQTKLLPEPLVYPEAPSETLPFASTKEAREAGPAVYWGDRLTFKCWLFCFGLMLAMILVEVLHRFVLLLMGRLSAP